MPVVATTVGAFPEIVADDATGDLVPPGDVDAMARAVARLLDDHSRLAGYSEAARVRMLEAFRIEAEAAAINAVYHRLLRAA